MNLLQSSVEEWQSAREILSLSLSLSLVLWCALFPFPDDNILVQHRLYKLKITHCLILQTHMHTPTIIILCKHVTFNYFIRFIFVLHSKHLLHRCRLHLILLLFLYDFNENCFVQWTKHTHTKNVLFLSLEYSIFFYFSLPLPFAQILLT